MDKLNKTEIKILMQLHLQGFWGKSGRLTVKQRLEYLKNLEAKGYLDSNCRLTKKASNILDEIHQNSIK